MKNLIWKIKQFLIEIFDDDAKWWCSNCGLLPSHCNDILEKGNNPHYCPQCGAKIIDYNEELPLAEPDITEEDFRNSIADKFDVADFNPCPKCGIHDKWRIGFSTYLLQDYIKTFKLHRVAMIYCRNCFYETHKYRTFEECLGEWNHVDNM